MSEFQTFSQPLVSGHLQVSHRRRVEGPGPAAGIALLWSERVVVRTGPHAFRVTVPVAGPLPGQASVERVLDAIRDLNEAVPAPARGCAITAVSGHVRPSSGLRSVLVLTITCADSGEDAHRDAAQIAGLVRNAARSCR